jgi:uncharacterized protein
MRLALLVLASVALASPALATRPSFDCAKAMHEIEQLVCRSDALAALDDRMFSVFTRALATVKADAGATKLLGARQRDWIRSRDDCWKAVGKSACTTLTYKKRTAELQAVYGLVPAYARVVYTCDGDPASELVARIYRTDPEVTLVERDHRTVTTYQTISADGARFEGGNTVYWDKGRDAMVTWDGKDMQCTQRQAK